MDTAEQLFKYSEEKFFFFFYLNVSLSFKADIQLDAIKQVGCKSPHFQKEFCPQMCNLSLYFNLPIAARECFRAAFHNKMEKKTQRKKERKKEKETQLHSSQIMRKRK